MEGTASLEATALSAVALRIALTSPALTSLSGFSLPEKTFCASAERGLALLVRYISTDRFSSARLRHQAESKPHLTDSEVVLMLAHSVTKDTVALEAGTAELFLFQGRVGEVLMDMGMLGAEKMGQLELEHNPLEGVGRGLLRVAE